VKYKYFTTIFASLVIIFLDLKNKIFKNKHYQFHNQIQTDGVSCCLLFIRKDLKDKKWGSRLPVLQDQEFHTIEDLSKEQLETFKPMKN
jgi:hypothetical protein